MTIYQKLLAVQMEIGGIKKEAENPFFKSKYFDINGLLNVVKPVLNKHGLVLLQGLTHLEGKPALSTMIAETGEGEEATIEFTCFLPDLADPQKAGSSLTYFRRFALQSLLALEAVDDDAESTKDRNVAHKPAQQATGAQEPLPAKQSRV